MEFNSKNLGIVEPRVECNICRSKAWVIHTNRIECFRCGVSYQTPNISSIPTNLIVNSIPSKEVLKAMEILDGPEE